MDRAIAYFEFRKWAKWLIDQDNFAALGNMVKASPRCIPSPPTLVLAGVSFIVVPEVCLHEQRTPTTPTLTTPSSPTAHHSSPQLTDNSPTYTDDIRPMPAHRHLPREGNGTTRVLL